MNTQLIQQQLISHLRSFGNNYSDGQSIYQINSIIHQTAGDESESLLIMLKGNYREDEEDKENEIYNKILSLDPNMLISDPEDSEELEDFKKIEISEEISKSGVQPIIWLTQYNDSYTLHATDHSIYIHIIQSGQY